MHLKTLFRLSIGGLLATLPTFALSDTIVLMADEWCPYNCAPDSDAPGFMIEIAREALAPFGHEIDYQTLNWARSLYRAEVGEIDGVIGAIPDEAPSLIFGAPIGTYSDAIAFRSGEVIDPDTLLDHGDLRLGAINGYEYYGVVNDYIALKEHDRSLVQYSSGDDALSKNLLKLVSDRLDMVAEARAVLEYTLAEDQLSDKVEIATVDEVDDIFIAFSPARPTSQTYADQLSEGVARLKESGRFYEIMLKYGQEIN